MSILVNSDSKIICQGITGNQGSFHTEQCIEYGAGERGYVDYMKGANIVAFIKVSKTMMGYGIV